MLIASIVCVLLAVPPSVDAPPGARAAPSALPRVVRRFIGAPGEPTIAAGGGAMTFSVVFDDPTNLFTPTMRAQITSHALAAGDIWASHIDGTGDITIGIRPDNVPRFTGRSWTTGFVAFRNGFNVYEQGWASEVRTGTDPNGAAADIDITIGQDLNYLNNELWFDPNPVARTATVPSNRTDAMSVFLHELGHALAFNGWINPTDGTLPGTYRSTTDERVTFQGNNLFFLGPATQQHYPGMLPLTFGNYMHLGNNAPRPGSDLIPDLMNGVVFYRGMRYHITDLDLAVCTDVGVAIRPSACGPSDLGGQGGTAGPDGTLDNNDFVVFINFFFAGDARADVGSQGGVAGGDGAWDNNDFVVFINDFFAGC